MEMYNETMFNNVYPSKIEVASNFEENNLASLTVIVIKRTTWLRF